MKYLFDTDSIDFFYNHEKEPQCSNIRAKFQELDDEDILQVSVLSVYELEYSYENAPKNKKDHITHTMRSMERAFKVLPLDRSFATVYARLKSTLKRSTGKKAKEMTKYNIDLMIAATAIAENSTLVSSDKIYQDLAALYPELKVENWAVEA